MLPGSYGMPSFYRFGSLVILLLLLCVSCVPSRAPEQQSAGSYHIGINSNVKATPIIIAEEKGFFKKNGLSVKVSRERSALHLLDGLYEGSYDFVCVPSFLVARDYVRGRQFSILAVLNRNQSRYVIMNPDFIENPAELAGKAIGISPDSAAEFVLLRFLTLHGVDPSRVLLQYYTQDALPEALASGAVSAILTWPPYVDEARTITRGNVLVTNAQMGVDMYWLLVTREEIPRESRDDVLRLFHALNDAYGLIFRNPREARNLVSESLMIPVPRIEEEWKDFFFMLEMPQSLLLIMEQQCEWIAERDGLNFDAAALFSRIEYQHLDAAYPERVSIIR